MSFIQVNKQNTFYIKSGNGKNVVILLHGWGQNTEMMKFIHDNLQQFFTVYSLDLPGFGKSNIMKEAFTADDYRDWLYDFIILNNINNPIIIGHSFGGHIAIRYAAKYDVKKLVLTGGAGLKPKRGLDYYIKVYSYKTIKCILSLPGLNKYKEKYTKNRGSSDYNNASGDLRKTFVNVVNSYVNDLLDQIQCPVLLVYGDQDVDTPLWMAKYFEKHLKNAGLVVFENRGHYAYYEESNRFNIIINEFLKEDIL